MKKIALLTALVIGIGSHLLMGQEMLRPSDYEISQAPNWAQAMYAQDPNVVEVDSLYKSYYQSHTFEKSYHTQYYKRWRRKIAPYLGRDGQVEMPSMAEQDRLNRAYLQKRALFAPNRGSGWSVVGPGLVRDNNNSPRANQTNVYCLAQSKSNPDIMYCGTEPGEVYRSSNAGQSWVSTFDNFDHPGGLNAMDVDPLDPDHVIASAGIYIYATTDGGNTWTTPAQYNSLGASEIQFHPTDPSLVFVAAQSGLIRSTDGGLTWNHLYFDPCWDIKWHSVNPAKAYLLKHNSVTNICEFFISQDSGATWTVQSNGWFNSTDPNRNDGGARLAVTPADTNRIYAYLIGAAKAGDDGFIGVYRSGYMNITICRPF